MSLRTKLVLMVIVPMLGIFTVLIAMQYRAMRETAIHEAWDRALLLTAATAQEIDADLSKAMFATDATSNAIATNEHISEDDVWLLLDQMVEDVPLVDGASIGWAADNIPTEQPAAPYSWNVNGTIHHRDLAEVYDYTQKEWYTIAASGNWGWTEPYDGPVYGGQLVSYSAPVLREGVFLGVVSVDVPLRPLQNLLQVGSFVDASAVLVSEADTYISHPMPEVIMKSVGTADEPVFLQDALRSSRPGTIHRTADWPRGTPHLVAFEPVQSTNWVLAAALAEEEVLAPVDEHLRWSIGVLLIGCLAITGIVLTMGLRMTAAVRALNAAVAGIAGGNLKARVESVRRADELGHLADSFNTMTDQLEETVHRVAHERGRREVMERELDVAREIQGAMLPTQFPQRSEVDLHAINIAARQVGGDFFDWWIRDDILTCVLADVTGSGVPAALVMVKAMTLLREYDDPDQSLVEAISRTNAELCNENERQMFVTGIVVRVNLGTGEYVLVNAGHPSAFIGDGHGRVVPEGDSTGPLIGVIPGGAWQSRSGALGPAGWLALFTDGIIEAPDAAGTQLGMDPLGEALSTQGDGDSRTLCEASITVAEDWHGGPVDDDLTVLVVRWRGI